MSQLFSINIRKKVALVILSVMTFNCSVGVVSASEQPKKPLRTLYNSTEYIEVSPHVLDGLDIKKVLHLVLQRAKNENMLSEMPNGVLNCYRALQRGKMVAKKDIEEAFPYIVYSLLPNWMIDAEGQIIEKALRPTIEGENPIVGAAACDISQVLKGLAKLKKVLCQKFEETWTMLEDIKETMCDKFEETWTMLEDIKETTCDKFEETWTVLDDIKETMCDKFEETWTMLEDIKETTCDKFEETWTVLDDIKETMCDKFQQTWTMLEDSKETMCDKFEETWTVLDEIKEATCDKFEETWTVLDNIDKDLEQCCELLMEDFEQTWSILDDLKDTVCQKADRVEIAVNECCERLSIEIDDAEATLCQKIDTHAQDTIDRFHGTWTILEDLQGCCSETLAELENCCNNNRQDFRETWTILNELNVEVDFGPVFTVVDELKEMTCDKFEQTWTMLGTVREGLCSGLNIIIDELESHCDAATRIEDPSGIIITQPGKYCLRTNIIGNIQINVPCVVLDLNGFKITPLEGDAVIVSGVSDVRVTNGQIAANDGAGIFVSGSAGVAIDEIDFVASQTAILATSDKVSNLEIESCSFRNNSQALILRNVSTVKVNKCQFYENNLDQLPEISLIDIATLSSRDIIFDHCCINSNRTAGTAYPVYIHDNATAVQFKNCQINNNVGDLNFAAVKVEGASECSFTTCECIQNTTAATVPNSSARGIWLDQADEVVIKNCTVESTRTLDFMNTSTIYGIAIDESSSCSVTDSFVKSVDQLDDLTSIGIDVSASTKTLIARNTLVGNNVGLAIFPPQPIASISALNNFTDNFVMNFVGLTAPLATLTKSTGVFAPPSPSPFDNISAV